MERCNVLNDKYVPIGNTILVHEITDDEVEKEFSVSIISCYSTNCNTVQIWSYCSRYLSSVRNVYSAIYEVLYVAAKKTVYKAETKQEPRTRQKIESK